MHVALAGCTTVLLQSLAFILSRDGHRVTIVGPLASLAGAAASVVADVWLVEVADAAQAPTVMELARKSGIGPVMVLADDLPALPVADLARAGVRGFADKRAPVPSLATLLGRVGAGEPLVVREAPAAGPRPNRAGADLAALARFLTPREREVVSALVRGDGTASMVAKTGMSAETVRSHVRSVLSKLGAHSRVQVVAAVVNAGLVQPHTGAWLDLTEQVPAS